MKAWLRLPKRLARRYAYVPIISEHDRESDELQEYEESGINDGFMKTTIDEFLETPGLTDRLRESHLRRLPEDGSRILLDWNVPEFVWQAVLTSKRLQETVQRYIGPDVRLDDLYLKNVMDGLAVGSGGWHDDNVGYRLKVFMVFDTEGSPSGTVIVPSSRPRIYKVQLRDEINRFVRSPTQEHREGEVLVDYKPGDCLVFDTNIPHRGDYTGGPGVRYCLMAEFIDRKKANRIHKHAPCGPGQGVHSIMIPDIVGVDPTTHPLIDASLLRPSQGGFEYGYQV